MIDPDAVVFNDERFGPFWAESETLRTEHLAEVGPREGMPVRVNGELLQLLDDYGALQTITVRSNGRLFGYLLTIISPSLENAACLVGTQTSAFVSKDLRGVGMRLQRASIDALRAKGVHELILRTGVRGSGPRLSSFYKRLGAKDFGAMFYLTLADV